MIGYGLDIASTGNILLRNPKTALLGGDWEQQTEFKWEELTDNAWEDWS